MDARKCVVCGATIAAADRDDGRRTCAGCADALERRKAAEAARRAGREVRRCSLCGDEFVVNAHQRQFCCQEHARHWMQGGARDMRAICDDGVRTYIVAAPTPQEKAANPAMKAEVLRLHMAEKDARAERAAAAMAGVRSSRPVRLSGRGSNWNDERED